MFVISSQPFPSLAHVTTVDPLQNVPGPVHTVGLLQTHAVPVQTSSDGQATAALYS